MEPFPTLYFIKINDLYWISEYISSETKQSIESIYLDSSVEFYTERFSIPQGNQIDLIKSKLFDAENNNSIENLNN